MNHLEIYDGLSADINLRLIVTGLSTRRVPTTNLTLTHKGIGIAYWMVFFCLFANTACPIIHVALDVSVSDNPD